MDAGLSVSISERNFCNELIKLTGHKFENRDLRIGLSAVIEYGGLLFDPISKNALSFLVDELQFAKRFRGEPTFAEGAGEESGTHSLHVARLVIAVADAVLPQASELEGEEKKRFIEEVNKFKADGAIAGLIHDLGEVLVGEFSTVRERVEQSVPHTEESSADHEKLIFVRSAALALHFAENDENGDAFKIALQEIRGKLPTETNEITLRGLDTAFDLYPAQLSEKSQSILKRWIELYDATEGTKGSSPTQEDQFLGACIKILERIQGQDHWNARSRKADGIDSIVVAGEIRKPWEISQEHAQLHSEQIRSNLVMSALVRTEGKLGELFQLAERDSREAAEICAQKPIAQVIRNRVYSTVLESLDTSTPLVKRTLEDPNEVITKRLKEAQARGEDAVPILKEEYEKILRAYRELRNAQRNQELSSSDHSQLLPIETRLRLQALYRNALDAGYEPKKGEVLALQDTIPDELLPLNPQNLGLTKRR